MKLAGIKVSIDVSDLSKLNDSDELIAIWDIMFGMHVNNVYSKSNRTVDEILKELNIKFEVLQGGLILNYYPANHLHL